jgi:transcriptional regulator with XRE-family HTH domain
MSLSSPKEILGKNLRRIRTEAGLSQEELAYRAGLHRTYVSSVERGERNISIENIFALAKALKVAPADLVDGTMATDSE